jgi:predicted MPP superfamily phosphohydrolase
VLRNQHRKITVNGADLYILGVDDTISAGVGQNAVVLDYIGMNDYLLKMEPTYQNSPKILLCHKPYAFDDIATRIYLTLHYQAIHTEGRLFLQVW